MPAYGLPTPNELGRSVDGVFRLIEADRSGLALIDASPTGFLRSFLAYVWCWPAQAFLWTGLWRDTPEIRPDTIGGMFGFFLTGSLFDFMSWVVPAVLIFAVSGLFGFRGSYMRLVAATNWFGLVATYIAFLPATVRYLAPVPDAFSAILAIASYGLTIWLYFRVARAALSGEATLAALVTLITLMTSIFLSSMAFRFMGL